MAQIAAKGRPQKSHVVKVTGVTDELLGMLDDRVRQRQATGRSEYIRELLRRDLLDDNGSSLRRILAPLHGQGVEGTDEEVDALFERARGEVYEERRRSQPKIR